MQRARSRAPLQIPCARKNLNQYAAGAVAAGVSVLALNPPAAAKIVYTPADESIALYATLNLDINHDGIVDFQFVNFLGSTTGAGDRLFFEGLRGNGAIEGKPESYYKFTAAALPERFLISPKRTFVAGQAFMASACVFSSCDFGPRSAGPWKHAQDQYLGLQFSIHGERHYGWARLTVSASPGQQVYATLTGYAYETVPDRPIVAGYIAGEYEETSTPLSIDSPSDASLGTLALGFRGLGAWRRDESE